MGAPPTRCGCQGQCVCWLSTTNDCESTFSGEENGELNGPTVSGGLHCMWTTAPSAELVGNRKCCILPAISKAPRQPILSTLMRQLKLLEEELCMARARAAKSEAALHAAQAHNEALESVLAMRDNQAATNDTAELSQPPNVDAGSFGQATAGALTDLGMAPAAAFTEEASAHACDGLFHWLCKKRDDLERSQQVLADQEAEYQELHSSLMGELQEATAASAGLAGLLQEMQHSMVLKRKLTVVVAALTQVEAQLNGVSGQLAIVGHCLGFWPDPQPALADPSPPPAHAE
eukprot:GGOE01021431.1.p1 GENE.GGOE01021431.1~~GGOE01021431.1.p1  ORF type:complete len:319 (-),score=62.30 GGOE01021431.1:411-1280(-)